MKKRLLFIIGIFLIGLSSSGQIQSVFPVSTAENGSLTAVAYDWEAIGVNPANLGWSINHNFSFTVLDMGISGQSGGMRFPTLMSALGSGSLATRANSWQQILGSPNGMDANADVNWFAVSFRIPTIPGAFAVNLHDQIMANAFLGPNASEALSSSNDRIHSDAATLALLNGTNLSYTHYRELNIDYGTKLFDWGGGYHDNDPATAKCFSFSKMSFGNGNGPGIYGGIGLKYIWGVANVNGGVSNGALNAIYDIDNNYPNIPSGFLNTPGHGEAVDLGLGVTYRRWKFGLAVTDIGSIKWEQGFHTTSDTSVAAITHGSDFISELKNGTMGGATSQIDYVTSLQAKTRMGASYTVNKYVLLSSDLIIPLNAVSGGLTGPYFALGSQLKVNKHIMLSTGFATASNDGWGIPLGMTIEPTSHFEFYVGTGDVTSYLGKQSNADISLAVWLLRFNF